MSTTADVLAGRARWACEAAEALEFLRGLPDDAADVVFTSPPFTDARTYGIEADRDSAAWAEWLRPIAVEACRVSKCLVFLNVSDSVENCVYGGGPEWLFADLTRLDGLAPVRPYVWYKTTPEDGDDPRNNGQPGSGGKHFHRNCWEPVYGFARPGKLPPPWSDQTAFGLPPKYRSGGAMTQRRKNGSRNATGRMVRYGHDGQPVVTNPGNVIRAQPGNDNPRATDVIRAQVGGGHLGHPLAHEGEAPMPLGVAERFVCWFCPPNGIVLDPFAGSGTTCHAAVLHGRRFVGCDLRESQCELTARRMRTVTADMFATHTEGV